MSSGWHARIAVTNCERILNRRSTKGKYKSRKPINLLYNVNLTFIYNQINQGIYPSNQPYA